MNLCLMWFSLSLFANADTPQISLPDTLCTIITLDTNLAWSNKLEGAKPYHPSQREFNQSMELLDSSISYYNLKGPYDLGTYELNLDDYYKQIVFGINEEQEIVVWINCLCVKNGINREDFVRRPIKRLGGTSCYFRVLMNLESRRAKVDVNGF